MVQTFTVQLLQQIMSDTRICYVRLCCQVDGSHLATYHLFGPMKQHFRGHQLSIPLVNHSSLFSCLKKVPHGSSQNILPHRRLSTRLFNNFCLSNCCQNLPCGDSWDVFSLFHGILGYVITFCMKNSKNQAIMDGTYIPNTDSTYSIQKQENASTFWKMPRNVHVPKNANLMNKYKL